MKLCIQVILWAMCVNAFSSVPLSLTVLPTESSFTVKLPANPTTGYQWRVISFDSTLLVLASSHYVAAQTQRMGAGGQMQFKFLVNPGVKRPAMTPLQFRYARPWEHVSEPLQPVTVYFKAGNQEKYP